MTILRLSCNLDKIALVRNARDHFGPDVTAAAQACLAAGAHGITLHPRADQRHALFSDIVAVMDLMAKRRAACEGKGIKDTAEMNVEGDLRPDLLEFVERIRPQQFTIVPVNLGEKTSERGWGARDDMELLALTVKNLGKISRLSLFIWGDVESVEMAARYGIQAVEFYTGPYALAEAAWHKEQGQEKAAQVKTTLAKTTLANLDRELEKLAAAATRARQLGLRVNAGHDLTLANLAKLVECVKPDEVSIGHALVSEAFLVGLPEAVRRFMAAMGG
ncbi:MAG: pyridoxine 5'-phosphate synthase [Candidatus Symbiobacter sp.]|nr:pyridoxine 5'-phosphate synthase [Candidatus Symbiobacter sp.]